MERIIGTCASTLAIILKFWPKTIKHFCLLNWQNIIQMHVTFVQITVFNISNPKITLLGALNNSLILKPRPLNFLFLQSRRISKKQYDTIWTNYTRFSYQITGPVIAGHALGIWIYQSSLFYRRELWASKSASFNSTKNLKICECKR